MKERRIKMLSCVRCNRPSVIRSSDFYVNLLINGLCRECEPELHRLYHARLDQLANANFQFHEQTGKDSFEDRSAFESFLVANRDKYPDIQPEESGT